MTDHSGDSNEKALLDEDGNPYEPYTQEELAIMWQTHHPQAEDGDSWFTGRWLATVKELQGERDRLREGLAFYADNTLYRWEPDSVGRFWQPAIAADHGDMARKALEPKEGTS